MYKKTLLIGMILCVSSIHTARRYPSSKQVVRTPVLHVYTPFREKRYTVEERTDGTAYICKQQLFSSNDFVSVPSVYCTPAQPLLVKNPQYIPYEARAWFDGKQMVIAKLPEGGLKGFVNVRASHNPPGNVITIGQTKNAYIVMDKGEAVWNTS